MTEKAAQGAFAVRALAWAHQRSWVLTACNALAAPPVAMDVFAGLRMQTRPACPPLGA